MKNKSGTNCTTLVLTTSKRIKKALAILFSLIIFYLKELYKFDI